MFQSVLQFLGDGFQGVLSWLDGFMLIGSFSMLDFMIAVFTIDIVISALFVTFNVSAGVSDYEYYDKKGNKRHGHKTTFSGSGHTHG